MHQEDSLTLSQLRERVHSVAGERAASEEVVDALVAGFSDPGTAERPMERSLGERGVIYAWRTEDADIVKATLETLEAVVELFRGHLAGAGLGIKDLVTFWVRLRRNRVRVSDPKQVAVLTTLKKQPAGLTASALWRTLNGSASQGALTLDDVEEALQGLTKAEAAAGVKQLVIADGQVWKCQI